MPSEMEAFFLSYKMKFTNQSLIQKTIFVITQ